MLFICSVIAVLAIGCAPAQVVEVDQPTQPAPPLARFMREELNVPFAFMMLEASASNRPRGRRVHKAASVLREAARSLVHWSDPPVESVQGREVFFAYAENLEYHVGVLEDAARDQQAEIAADTVEQIRQTCNSCHRFFRPASVISPDVAYDGYVLDFGGLR